MRTKHIRNHLGSVAALSVILSASVIVERGVFAQSQTIRVSVGSGGEQANGQSIGAFLSENGRYVAFLSYASNLVPGDTNGQPDVFLRDLHTGTTQRVSLGSAGQQLSDGGVLLGLSPDGNKVAFGTAAVDAVPGYFGMNQRIVVRDVSSGVNVLANLMSNGQLSNRQSGIAVFSANLRYVVFAEHNPNDPWSSYRMWRRDLLLGTVQQLPVPYDSPTTEVSVSDDGRWIGYSQYMQGSSLRTVYLLDSVSNGALQISSPFMSSPCGGYVTAEDPIVSRDGSKFVFTSNGGFVPGLLASGSCRHVFEYDRLTGSIRALAVAPDGTPANGAGLSSGSPVARFGARSADGSAVVFTTTSTNLVPQSPGKRGLVLKRLATGANELVDLQLDGTDCSIPSVPASTVYAPSVGHALSGNARYVAFSSTCDQVVANDTNGTGDVFVRDRWFPDPVNFCEAKPNSQGCLPRMGWQGTASLGGADDFYVQATQVRNSSAGILFWGTGPDRVPFAGGYRCVRAPIIRSGLANSGGTPYPGVDCSGSYSFHFSHAYMASYLLMPGLSLYAQYWQRDGLHPDGTGQGLTDGLEFTITP